MGCGLPPWGRSRILWVFRTGFYPMGSLTSVQDLPQGVKDGFPRFLDFFECKQNCEYGF
jgi:hypothetical protein